MQKQETTLSQKGSILIVDDAKTSLVLLQKHLQRQGYNVLCASNGKEALLLLEAHKVDLVISDLIMPEMDGIELMHAAKQHQPTLPFIICTASGSIEGAVAAVKEGALDYLEKPFHLKAIDLVLQRTFKITRLTNENVQLREHFSEGFSFHNIVTQSPAMHQTLKLAARVAQSPQTTISLTGESGVGKEVLAKAVHFKSGCLPNRFVAVNCASIPESLLESELFGHVRGAFTGAEREHEGKFSLAHGGTVLLDEIGDMPLSLQAKLLRVLEERTYEKVGSNVSEKANFRVIVATHRNLAEMVEQGKFRQDLFHRINVVPISIPPLRERKEDIPLLVDFFLNTLRKHLGKSLPGISKKALDVVVSYGWPSNVRELRNVLEYAAIMVSDELIRPEHLHIPALEARSSLPDNNTINFNVSLSVKDLSLEAITKKILDIALQYSSGNKSKAAALRVLSASLPILPEQ